MSFWVSSRNWTWVMLLAGKGWFWKKKKKKTPKWLLLTVTVFKWVNWRPGSNLTSICFRHKLNNIRLGYSRWLNCGAKLQILLKSVFLHRGYQIFKCFLKKNFHLNFSEVQLFFPINCFENSNSIPMDLNQYNYKSVQPPSCDTKNIEITNAFDCVRASNTSSGWVPSPCEKILQS